MTFKFIYFKFNYYFDKIELYKYYLLLYLIAYLYKRKLLLLKYYCAILYLFIILINFYS